MNKENFSENVYDCAVKENLVLRISFDKIYKTHINNHHLATTIYWIRWNSFEGKFGYRCECIAPQRRRIIIITITTKMHNSKGVVYLYLVVFFCIGVKAGNGNFFYSIKITCF